MADHEMIRPAVEFEHLPLAITTMASSNPFYPPTASASSSAARPNYDASAYSYDNYGYGASSSSAPVPANAYEYDVGYLAQQSVYVLGAMIDKRGGSGGKISKGGKRTTVLRKGAGKVWEDQTLLDWDESASLLRQHYSVASHHLM